MRGRAILTAVCLIALASPAMTDENKGGLKTRKDKVSYMIGVDMGRRMKAELEKQSIDHDPAIIAKAVRDALSGGKVLLTDDELATVRTALQEELQAKNRERTKALAEKNKKEGPVFLEANAKKEGVKTTATGLQYKVLIQGKGRIPQKTDTVTVNYRGTFIDGTEFDSSERRGKPATFSLDQVVPGWTEALTLMNEGSKWQIVVPPSLGYGPIGTPGGPIGPHAVLIFEIELLAIGQGPQAAGQLVPGAMSK
ncbi:MAG: FKBP-type peptidyl-prolyl cis-trans isomerase [Nitrospirota bacterium]